jgi:conjugal transfer pilus assembly protein TraF
MIKFCVSYQNLSSKFCVSYRLLLLMILMMIFSSFIHAEKPVGRLWYNLPQEKKEVEKKPKGVSFSQLSYTDKDAVLHFYTMEALHKVRFTHDLEDEKNFLALQNFWLKEAQIHGKLNQKALIAYPEYDYSVTHPTSNIGIKIQDSLEYEKKNKALEKIAKKQGFIFYYRGNSALDTRQIPILQAFCKEYGFQMIGVSVDGVVADSLPESRIDQGEAEAMNVHYFPAILLVNPKTKYVTPVAYGLTTQDVLVEHLWVIQKNFQGEVNA